MYHYEEKVVQDVCIFFFFIINVSIKEIEWIALDGKLMIKANEK